VVIVPKAIMPLYCTNTQRFLCSRKSLIDTASAACAGLYRETPLGHVKPQGAWHGPKKWRNPKRAWVGQFKSDLLAIDGVEDVVFARYHLTIEKGQMYSWKNIQPAVVKGNRKGYRFFQCGLRLIDGRYGLAGRR
jgi:hypothetical protein